jgi:hypothetical protein
VIGAPVRLSPLVFMDINGPKSAARNRSLT